MSKEEVFEDIVVVPNRDILSVEVHRGEWGSLDKGTEIDVSGYNEPFFLRGTAETQFFKLLGLRKYQVENAAYRDALVMVACEKRDRPIVLRTAAGKVYAVVTDKFVHIGHSEAFGVVELAFKKNFVEYEKGEFFRTNQKVMQVYYVESDGFGLRSGLLVQNSVKGLGSLAVRRYYQIEVCSNGLISGVEAEAYSRQHIGNKDKILREFALKCLNIISNLDISREIGIAKIIRLENDEVLYICRNLKVSQTATQDILGVLVESSKSRISLWDFVMAMTTVAGQQRSVNVRLQLERNALRLIEDSNFLEKVRQWDCTEKSSSTSERGSYLQTTLPNH